LQSSWVIENQIGSEFWQTDFIESEMLIKLTPVVNFIIILWAHFLYKKLARKIQSQKVSRKKLLKDFCTKDACKSLMKLTPSCRRLLTRILLLDKRESQHFSFTHTVQTDLNWTFFPTVQVSVIRVVFLANFVK